VPTIAVEPPRTPQQMERAVKGLVTGRYEWIAFTSRNAVKAVRERFEEYGLDARAFSGIKVAAVGEQTAADLVAWGIKPDLVPSGEQSSAGLLEDWPAYDPVFDPIDRVFLPRADIATETLVAGLTELAGRSTTSPPTAPCAPLRRPPRPGRPSRAVASTRWCSRRPRRSATWSASPASRTRRRSSPASGRRPPRPRRSTALRVDVLAPEPSVPSPLGRRPCGVRRVAPARRGRGRRAAAAPVAAARTAARRKAR
jgi:uroporphyrinogen III methyltransferase/synthase